MDQIKRPKAGELDVLAADQGVFHMNNDHVNNLPRLLLGDSTVCLIDRFGKIRFDQ